MVQFLTSLFSKNKLVVLMYHHVGAVTDESESIYFIDTEMFERQLAYLCENGYRALRLEEVEQAYLNGKPFPEKSVLLTLDDGWHDNYLNAFPLAKKYNVPITIFLSSDLVGNDPDLLSWEEVREMHQSGLVSFASHGATHRRLRDLSDEDVLKELITSKKTIEKRLDITIRSFCYPYGAVDRRVRRLFRQTDYTFDFGTRQGVNRGTWLGCRPILRTHVFRDDTLADFAHQLRYGRK